VSIRDPAPPKTSTLLSEFGSVSGTATTVCP
jgi:hypothetical protein